MEDIKRAVKQASKDTFNVDIEPEISRPEEKFGDYATNVAMQLAGKAGKNPREVAEQLAGSLRQNQSFEAVEVAGPGFLNITLKTKDIWNIASNATNSSKILAGQTAVAEYSDPNPFKILHAGHLYTSVVGDAIANLLENAGANVHRVNFTGDVGPHVAKNIWAIIKTLGGEFPEKLTEVKEEDRADWLSRRYVEGNSAYEDNESAKNEILELNKKIYQLHEQNDHESALAKIYWTCRAWSYDYFDKFYSRIGTKFEKYYLESDTAPIGLKVVKEQLDKRVYQTSNGAVIFDGEKYGLHKRVFINSQGLPTYEAKDVGLIISKWNDYHFDRSFIITGDDIEQ
ncbi:MAG: Arginine--tRNA ligase, partial [Candidatus Saccharibacteria bacterium]|nr:Arginine--tRNA ligase [Candidatus Saccharibacteria bacterium]